jgi:histidyl-tRNA synthetase
MLCRRLWDDLGLDDIRLELNSIGNAEERQRHRADLIAYFEAHATCSTPKPSAACTPIRCASSTPRIRRCRTW